VISRRAIRSFAERRPEALEPLLLWASATESADWRSPADVRLTFNTAYFVGELTVFDVGRNKGRVIVFVQGIRQESVEEKSTSIIDLDTRRYGRLLAKALPGVIKSEGENDRVLGIVEDLMAKGEGNLTPEEGALLELLVDLTHDFEEQHYPLPAVPPRGMVAFLLEQRGLKPSALWQVPGSRGRVSEILAGKRGISKEQAKRLAAFFRVGVELFI